MRTVELHLYGAGVVLLGEVDVVQSALVYFLTIGSIDANYERFFLSQAVAVVNIEFYRELSVGVVVKEL